MSVGQSIDAVRVSGPGDRRAHLDHLKIVLTTAVIVAHAGMTYGALGSWVYEEPALSAPVEVVVSAAIAFGAMFGLGLFYLVAGALTPGPLARRGATDMLANRVVRLGFPLLIYIVIVWPLLRWLVQRATGGAPALSTHLREQFTTDAVWSLGSGPLWFVAVLLGLTVGWVLWRVVHPRPDGAGPRPLRLRHLVSAGTVIALGSFGVRLVFPVDSAQFLDLHVWLWPQCLAMFVFGAVGAERGWFEDLPPKVRRGCVAAAVAAAVGLGAMAAVGGDQDAFSGGWRWQATGLGVVEATLAITMSMLALDWFRRHRDHGGVLTRRLARGSYPAFVVQGPVLVGVALILRPVPLAGDVKFVSLAVAAVVGSYAISLSYVRARGLMRRMLPTDRETAGREPP